LALIIYRFHADYIYIYFETLPSMCIITVVEWAGITTCKPNLAATYIVFCLLQFC